VLPSRREELLITFQDKSNKVCRKSTKSNSCANNLAELELRARGLLLVDSVGLESVTNLKEPFMK
jgi:hypothetical protein